MAACSNPREMWQPPQRIKHELPPASWPSAQEAAGARLFQPGQLGPRRVDFAHGEVAIFVPQQHRTPVDAGQKWRDMRHLRQGYRQWLKASHRLGHL